jgi:hypothetical protein
MAERAVTLEAGRSDRLANMRAFAAAALELLAVSLERVTGGRSLAYWILERPSRDGLLFPLEEMLHDMRPMLAPRRTYGGRCPMSAFKRADVSSATVYLIGGKKAYPLLSGFLRQL